MQNGKICRQFFNNAKNDCGTQIVGTRNDESKYFFLQNVTFTAQRL